MIVFLSLCSALAEPPEVAEIRDLWAAASTDDAMVTEIDFNAGETPVAAVGVWSHTVAWVRPRLNEGPGFAELPVKIIEEAQVSAPTWSGEYLYEAGALRFAVVEDPDAGTLRAYYTEDGSVVRLVVGDETLDPPAGEAQRQAEKIATHGKELMERARAVLAFADDYEPLRE